MEAVLVRHFLWLAFMTLELAPVLQYVHGQGNLPPGHLRPLGNHRDPEGTVDVVEGFIEPTKFYEEYVKPGRPLLFKGAAQNLPAYKLWTDSYLQQKHGNLQVQVETMKKEDRAQDVLFMSMQEFLEQYNRRDIFMVHDAPNELHEEVGVPKPFLCGGFQDNLQTCIIWFSSGGTRSVLHSDDLDNINCLLDGEKDFVMIDRAYKEDMEADGFVTNGAYSKVDVDAVDFEKFPRLQTLPWWKAEMKKGDCLYIPVLWYHQVNSRGRNLAVNLWAFHLLWFNQTDCDAYTEDVKQDFIPLSQFDMYDRESPESARSVLFQRFEGLEHLTVEDIHKKFGHILTDQEGQEFFELLDLDKDFQVSWEEIYSADLEDILSEFKQLLPEEEEEEEEDTEQHVIDEL